MFEVQRNEAFTAEEVAAGGSETSDAIDLRHSAPNGMFSVYVELTGDGTCKLEYLLSWDGTTYITPTGASDIVTAHTVGSGPGSDGKDSYSFQPKVAPFMKIKATETGSADTVTLAKCIVAFQ